MLAAFQAGSRGTQACIMAANSVQGIISDIDTTILFANSGALNPECSDDTFAIYKDEILKTARTLVEDTKTLVAGAASSQEALADAAQNAVTTITQLTAAVKQGAATLGSSNSEAQVMLLNSIKDVAIALNELIEATKTASGKNINDPAMMHLKDSAKVLFCLNSIDHKILICFCSFIFQSIHQSIGDGDQCHFAVENSENC